MNPRPVAFEGVARPDATVRLAGPGATGIKADAVALQRDLMREHAAVGQAFGAVARQFVPRVLPKTMGTTTFSAASWDLVIVVGDGTIYLPKLGLEDGGDEVKVAVRGNVEVVADDGSVMNGSGVISPGPFIQRFTWDGAEWWVG